MNSLINQILLEKKAEGRGQRAEGRRMKKFHTSHFILHPGNFLHSYPPWQLAVGQEISFFIG
ncbi:hypothetical protein CBP15_04905 [Fischerella thermalis WC442]|nr:hypothetical protein CBP19_20095 [Fischerella thermalis WC1110]PLZ20201.1 hypothetical protein CBP30_11860 [Fischerella thermalis WC157]PLZ47867.1 hypothetical protein CBP13_21415 [Fischerella thermalis WC441]PLZ57507.1 hypothetical protein CBP15_04905 [Fischerella thermalis WC442]PLZ58294.1 hypothetical protein CBP24_08330 [Fischerella thermalis WC439]PLZ60993.1 hypothetical protein CBP23_14155 [Fischerella thermalis WC344]PLZ72750.1 hypothetical protein CBP14_16930 [Fischerella thermalis